MAAAPRASTWSMAALVLLLVALSAAEAAAGSTVVAGMVFCDQCKDGARGLFDYPLYGARVAIQCGGGETPLTVRECNTNWFGGFSVRMEGSPDMNRCTARLLQGTPHCPGGSTAPPQQRDLTLAFRMLGLALYTVQPLLSHPDHPMDFCPAAAPPPTFPDPTAAAAAPSSYAPVSSPPAPVVPFWRRPRPRRLPPIWRRPPTIPQERPEPDTKPKPADAQLPPPPPPPPPTTPVGSACTYDKWALAEHRCHWKVVTPNTTVAMAFGPLAAQRYGADLTLRDALDGRGDMYRTLLREATAALLNAYYNPPVTAAASSFLYPTTASVIDHLNGALLSASTQRVLIEGARFRRANAGGGGPAGRTKLPCDFTPCNTTTTS